MGAIHLLSGPPTVNNKAKISSAALSAAVRLLIEEGFLLHTIASLRLLPGAVYEQRFIKQPGSALPLATTTVQRVSFAFLNRTVRY